ncbi:uncharacterized protein LOC125529968 [Triticum urartu]|uniref:uncharacterized protein LOC125529968 n=1 Tax=Triticum urartu TaxID=4572 RepID=UPI002043AB1C|nr:uncharacterized protein LOC125529968 [Triticum urartu]
MTSLRKNSLRIPSFPVSSQQPGRRDAINHRAVTRNLEQVQDRHRLRPTRIELHGSRRTGQIRRRGDDLHHCPATLHTLRAQPRPPRRLASAWTTCTTVLLPQNRRRRRLLATSPTQVASPTSDWCLLLCSENVSCCPDPFSLS